MTFKFIVDGENNSSWWDNGGHGVWDHIESTGQFDDEDGGYFLPKEEGVKTLQEAVLIDGWEGGPRHAPHPLIVYVNDD